MYEILAISRFYSCYTYRVKATPISVMLMLVTLMAAAFTVNRAREPQAPSAGTTGATPQNQAKSDAKASPKSGGRKIPCKTPQNASLCYWTHGRLDFYTGYPPLRIWKIGTRRILAVYSGPSSFPARDTSRLYLPELPANLARIYRDPLNWDEPEPLLDDSVYNARSIIADFEVCPLAPEKQRKVQPVCVEQALKVFVEK